MINKAWTNFSIQTNTTFSYCKLSCTIKLSLLSSRNSLKLLIVYTCMSPIDTLFPRHQQLTTHEPHFRHTKRRRKPGRTQMANMHNGLNRNYAHVSRSLNAFPATPPHTEGQQLLEVSGKRQEENNNKTRKSDNKTIIKIQRISGTRPSRNRR